VPELADRVAGVAGQDLHLLVTVMHARPTGRQPDSSEARAPSAITIQFWKSSTRLSFDF
jgi:hypothetical protein